MPIPVERTVPYRKWMKFDRFFPVRIMRIRVYVEIELTPQQTAEAVYIDDFLAAKAQVEVLYMARLMASNSTIANENKDPSAERYSCCGVIDARRVEIAKVFLTSALSSSVIDRQPSQQSAPRGLSIVCQQRMANLLRQAEVRLQQRPLPKSVNAPAYAWLDFGTTALCQLRSLKKSRLCSHYWQIPA